MEPVALFTVSAALYLAVGVWLGTNGVSFPDAYSRVAHAMYVLYSRDPHLGAIGAVWNPLPSVSMLPLLPLHEVFPALLGRGLAGSVSSAVCLAAAVPVLASCLRRLGVADRGLRLGVTSAFALQPIVLLYAGSGLSEPMMLLWLLVLTAALTAWLRTPDPALLVVAGVALALVYLTRYEGAATAAAVTVLVVLVTLRRAPGDPRWRLCVSATDAVLVAGPVLVSFAASAVAARSLAGEWLPILSSRYGNTSQVQAQTRDIERYTGTDVWDRLSFVAQQSIWLAPALLLVIVAVAAMIERTRDLTPIAAVIVLGSVAVTTVALSLAGLTFAWLRLQVTIVPLTVLLAGFVAARLRRAWVTAGLLLALLASIPTQARLLSDSGTGLAREEAPMLVGLLFPDRAKYEDYVTVHRFDVEQEMAAEIDALQLPDGSVLGDSAFLYPVLLATTRPTTYVIASDRDFDSALASPRDHAIRFLLVCDCGTSDAVSLAYPSPVRGRCRDRRAGPRTEQPSEPDLAAVPARLVRTLAVSTSTRPGRSKSLLWARPKRFELPTF